MQNLILTHPFSDENNSYVPVDIISPSSATNGRSIVFFLHSNSFSFGYIRVPDKTNITTTELIRVNDIDTTMSFDYQYISNFVYFPEGVDSQYFFIYSGALYSVRLDRLTLQRSPPNIDDSCDRLAYNGDHAFYAYCNSEQASFTYSTDEETIDAQSNIGTDGIPYVCMSSDSIFQVYLNSTDQSTVVQHNGQRNFTTSGQNLTFGECYDEDTFFLVNDQGIKVLRPSDGSFSTISSSHNSRSFVVFDGPYLVAQGDDPPRVTLYDTSLQSIVAWSGSAMAVGVITDLTLAPSSTSLTAPVPTTTLPVPSTSVPPMSAPTTPTTTPTVPSPTKDTLLKSGELAGIGVAVFVLVVLFSAILITIW